MNIRKIIMRMMDGWTNAFSFSQHICTKLLDHDRKHLRASQKIEWKKKQRFEWEMDF